MDKTMIGRQMAFIAVAGLDATFKCYEAVYGITTEHSLAAMIKTAEHVKENWDDKYIGHANKNVISCLVHGLRQLEKA